ncbi:hypothetical protein [Kitasatospora sp. LaBMicrA B282]|uniref:hypothetical protein n=1 Tax=Kitasatospora sp. LaBMicrA B282 TaxID=3420949 RepID=UPI003D099D8E
MTDPAASAPQHPTLGDRRHADLHAAVHTWLETHRLHPDPGTYLSHGYLRLCLRAWPAASGAPLLLAATWAVWTWLADDVLEVWVVAAGESRWVLRDHLPRRRSGLRPVTRPSRRQEGGPTGRR